MSTSHTARISLKLRELNQLFNSMDPSPFLDRDLDDDAEEFIVSSVRELHGSHAFELVVHLGSPPDPEKAAVAEHAAPRWISQPPGPHPGVMHAKISHRSAPVMKSILVPVDFSAVTSRVVDSAIKLARMAKARVVLLHVVPSPSVIRNVLPAVEDVRMRQASTGHQAEKKLIELKRAFRRKCS